MLNRFFCTFNLAKIKETTHITKQVQLQSHLFHDDWTYYLKILKGCDFMLYDKQIQHLKAELLKMKEQSIKVERTTDQKESIKETSGELSMYDNHPGDMGTALYDREKNRALNEHAESDIRKIDAALTAIQEGTYGKCEVCQKDIPYERLQTVPYTTFCIEHAKMAEQSIAEDLALNEIENPFKSTQDPLAIDYENSFEEVAEFGTSDSPSDFIDPAKPSYHDDEKGEPKMIDQMVEKSVTDNTNDH